MAIGIIVQSNKYACFAHTSRFEVTTKQAKQSKNKEPTEAKSKDKASKDYCRLKLYTEKLSHKGKKRHLATESWKARHVYTDGD